MAANAPGRWRTIVVWALRMVLGALFLFVGITKLTGTANTVAYFAAIGWGQWFRYLTGVLDVVGAVLLFVPRWTWLGAVMLFSSVGSAALISLTVFRGDPNWGGPVTIAAPLVLTLLCALLAWMTRPQRL